MQPTGAGVLQVEPTDHCNLSCSMCAPHHEGWAEVHKISKGYLDISLWESIVKSFVEDDVRFDHIIFQWLGDPSLHPELPSLVGIAAQQLGGRVGYLRIDTNGIRLSPTRIEEILTGQCHPDVPPLLIVFTIDAVTEATYTLVKGHDRLAQVKRNIRHLIRFRSALGAGCKVNLQLQFVVQPGNGHEAPSFLRYWRDLLKCQGRGTWHDEVMFKRLSVGGGAQGQAAADELYERSVAGITAGKNGPVHVLLWTRRPWQNDDGHHGPRGACPGLWLTPVIRHDGQLMMCCADLGGELTLGSLRTQRFTTLWEGAAATQHRLAHLDGRFEGVCAGCGGINWYGLTSEMAEGARKRGAALGLSEGS